MSDFSFDTGDSSEEGPRTEADPRTYLRALWRWKWIFFPILVAIPVAVYLVVSQQPKVYRSSALLEIQPVAIDTSEFSAGGAPSSAQILNAAAALITTTPVADQAARQLPPPRPTGRSLLRGVSASADVNTGFITITADAMSPQRAAAVANAFASAIAVTRAQQAIRSLDSAIAELSQELQSLPFANRSGRLQLRRQIQQDRALRVAQGSNAQILQAAEPVSTPVSPHIKNAVLLGLVAAVFVGLVAVALAEVADRRLRRIEDLEELAASPAIGVIPTSAFSASPATIAEREAFQSLRAALTYFNVDRPRQTVVVSSPGKADGKTTVAVQLAIACARAGEDVLLIDADLRHPQIADRLGLPGEIGLASALAGKATLDEALIPYELAPAATGRLRIIAGRELPPNASPAPGLATDAGAAGMDPRSTRYRDYRHEPGSDGR